MGMIHPERRRENLKKIEEMDREKVIKGLEVCVDRVPGKYTCDKCPYETDGNDCEINLTKDTLVLLKEQGEEIKRLKGELHGFGDLFHALSEKTEIAIADQPKVVRCKDCKYHSGTEILEYKVCTKWKNWVRNFATADNWFCADGKRR